MMIRHLKIHYFGGLRKSEIKMTPPVQQSDCLEEERNSEDIVQSDDMATDTSYSSDDDDGEVATRRNYRK